MSDTATSSHTNNNNMSLKMFLEKCTLDGSNFIEWPLKLEIALKYEAKLYAIEEPLPEAPASTASRAVQDAHEKHVKETNEVACIMLSAMTFELQKQMRHLGAYDMYNQLKDMFQQQARQERFECVKALFGCRMQEGGNISQHVLKMKAYVDRLERLGCTLGRELTADIILQSMPAS